MTTGAQRDQRQLQAGLARWVAAHGDLVPGADGGHGGGSGLKVTGVQHAEGGMANETVMVELGPEHPGVVVRLAPLTPTFPDYDLSVQAVVQNAVAAGGIPAPAPAVFVEDRGWIGTPFLVMPQVSGFIPGPAPLFDPVIAGATPQRQREYHDGLFGVLARLHAVDWSAGALGDVLPGPTAARALERWTSYVEWAGAGTSLPILTRALSWCHDHRPAGADSPDHAVLVWGDARLGNLVFDDDARVHAVLDWDLAAIGPPEMDLGWYFGLDFMMGQLFGHRVPGFPDRAAAVDRYETASGRTVTDLAWHEVFALVRALAINDRHQRIGEEQRREATGRPPSPRRLANPMIDVLAARLATAG